MTKIPTWKGIISFTLLSPAKLADKKYYKKVWLSSCLLMAAILLFSTSCDNELAGDTGLPVLPINEQVELVFSDTFSIDLNTRIIDSLATGNQPAVLFGNYIDPQFGRLSAGIYSRVRKPDSLWDFNNPQLLELDSAVLFLDVVDSYGRFDFIQDPRVFELGDTIPPLDLVDSKSSVPLLNGTNLATGPRIDFSEDTVTRDIRIRLSRDFAEKLFFASESDYNTDADFLNLFKGFYITTEKVGYLSREPGAIFRVNASDFGANNNLLLYYRARTSVSADPERKIAFFSLQFARKFYSIERTESEDKLLEIAQSPEHMYEFVQAGGLIEIHGDFPSIQSLQEDSGINLAELVLKVDTTLLGAAINDFDNSFNPPFTLEIEFLDSEGNEFIPDNLGTRLFTPYNPETGEYVFPLTQYLQGWISQSNGFKIEKFIIRPQTPNFSVNRAVIGGVMHPSLAPELRITYTRQKQ